MPDVSYYTVQDDDTCSTIAKKNCPESPEKEWYDVICGCEGDKECDSDGGVCANLQSGDILQYNCESNCPAKRCDRVSYSECVFNETEDSCQKDATCSWSEDYCTSKLKTCWDIANHYCGPGRQWDDVICGCKGKTCDSDGVCANLQMGDILQYSCDKSCKCPEMCPEDLPIPIPSTNSDRCCNWSDPLDVNKCDSTENYKCSNCKINPTVYCPKDAPYWVSKVNMPAEAHCSTTPDSDNPDNPILCKHAATSTQTPDLYRYHLCQNNPCVAAKNCSLQETNDKPHV
jgi:hypothetical protein